MTNNKNIKIKVREINCYELMKITFMIIMCLVALKILNTTEEIAGVFIGAELEFINENEYEDTNN